MKKMCPFLCEEILPFFLKDGLQLELNHNGSHWHTFLSLHCLDTKGYIYVQIVNFDEQIWNKVNTNLKLFFKSFVCPAILEFKPIAYCGNCDTVLLEESDQGPFSEK